MSEGIDTPSTQRTRTATPESLAAQCDNLVCGVIVWLISTVTSQTESVDVDSSAISTASAESSIESAVALSSNVKVGLP